MAARQRALIFDQAIMKTSWRRLLQINWFGFHIQTWMTIVSQNNVWHYFGFKVGDNGEPRDLNEASCWQFF